MKLLWCLVVVFLLPLPAAVTASAAPVGGLSGRFADKEPTAGRLALSIHEFHSVPHACRIERDCHDTQVDLVAVLADLPAADRL
ncbi:MAG: hypothetical protein ABIF77_20255 [bacterium]